MTEEMVTKYRCDRCGHVEEVPMSVGLLGMTRKPAPPASWGPDLLQKVKFCAGCYKEYQDGYMHWFEAFMKGELEQ
jgi:hypothetical protein